MTSVDQDVVQIVGRLRAAMAVIEGRPKVSSTCKTLLENFDKPVRLGLFGLPDPAPRRVLDVFVGDIGLDADLALPTVQLTYGDQVQTTAMLPDGTELQEADLPNGQLMDLAPVFLKVKAPAPRLQSHSILLVSADATLSDMAAALAWAAPSVDMAIWCTRHWNDFEQSVWEQAPETLQDHALLVWTESQALDAVSGFEGVFSLMQDAHGTEGLITYVHSIIQDALREDVLAAEVFLMRNGFEDIEPVPPVPSPETHVTEIDLGAEGHSANTRSDDVEAKREIAPVSGASSVNPSPSTHKPEATSHTTQRPSTKKPESHADLSKLFQIVRNSAYGLSVQIQNDMSSDDQLSAFEEVFEKLTDHVSEMDTIMENHPDLQDTLFDARDVATLMRVEGNPEHVEDAALLLLQVRREIEEKLAA